MLAFIESEPILTQAAHAKRLEESPEWALVLGLGYNDAQKRNLIYQHLGKLLPLSYCPLATRCLPPPHTHPPPPYPPSQPGQVCKHACRQASAGALAEPRTVATAKGGRQARSGITLVHLLACKYACACLLLASTALQPCSTVALQPCGPPPGCRLQAVGGRLQACSKQVADCSPATLQHCSTVALRL